MNYLLLPIHSLQKNRRSSSKNALSVKQKILNILALDVSRRLVAYNALKTTRWNLTAVVNLITQGTLIRITIVMPLQIKITNI